MPRDHFIHDPEHIKFIRFRAEIVLPSGVSQKSVSRAVKDLTSSYARSRAQPHNGSGSVPLSSSVR